MRLLALWIATAAALLAWSEFLFVNEGPTRDLLGPDGASGLVSYLGFYLIPAAAWLALCRLSWPARWWQAVLAGSIVGWVIEGAVVPAVYEAPPFSFLWTSVAWHAPVDVLLGLWVLPRILSGEAGWHLPALLLPLGLLFGVWAHWPAVPGDESLDLTLGQVAFLYGVSVPLAALGALTWAYWGQRALLLPRWAALLALAVCAGLGVLQGLAVPVFAVPLAGCVALVLWAYLKTARAPAEQLDPKPARALWFLGFGAAAMLGFWLVEMSALKVDTELLVFSMFCVGTLTFIVAFARAFTAR